MFEMATGTVALLISQQAAGSAGSSGGASSVDITQVLQFGLLGLIFVCVLFRKYLVPEWTLRQAEDRSKAEKDDLTARLIETREQLDKLQDVFQDQMIPALTRATEINARYTEELQKARYSRGTRKPPPEE